MTLMLLRATSAFLMLALALTGCTKTPEQLVESATKRVAKGDRAGAIVDLKAAIQAKPTDGAIRLTLGRLYNEIFDHVSAEKEIKKAAELGVVGGGTAAVELARAYAGQRKWADLLEKVEPSPVFEPDQLATIQALRGVAHYVRGDVEAANSSLAAARAVSANNPDAIMLAADLAAGRGEMESALAMIDELLTKHPNHFGALSYRAAILAIEGRSEEALATYGQMLKSYPHHFGALLNRSMVLTSLGRLDEAQKDVEELQKAFGREPRVLVQRGILSLIRQRPREALESAAEARKVDPEFGPAQLLEGAALGALKSYEQAAQVLRQYLTGNPENRLARRLLARVLLQKGEATQAMEVMGAVLKPGVATYEDYLIAADAALKRGQYADAHRWYEQAEASGASGSAAKVKHSAALMAIGKFDEGSQLLEGALAQTRTVSKTDEILVFTYLARGDIGSAHRVVQDLDRRDPKNPTTLNLRGIVAGREGKLDDAKRLFEAALKSDPGFFPAAHNLAMLDISERNFERAKSRFEAVLAHDPKHLDAILALSELERRTGRREDAVKLLERAVSTSATAFEPRERLVRIYLDSAKFDEALVVAEGALAANPDHPRALLLAGEARAAKGNWNGASQAFRRLVQLLPKSEEALFRLAEVEFMAGRLDEAESILKKTLAMRSGYTPAQLSMVSLLMQRNRIAEAMAFAKQVQKSQPKSSLGFHMEGEVLEKQGKYADAISLYRQGMQRYPSTDAAIRIYRAMKRAGDLKGAMQELMAWLAKSPRDKAVRLLLGHEMLSAHQYKTAAEHFEAVVADHPRDFNVLNDLAWTYFKLEDSRALSTAERAFSLSGGAPAPADTLGWILVNQGALERGRAMLEKAAKAAPENPEIRYHLAVALAKSGDREAARKELASLLASDGTFSEKEQARALLNSLGR